MKLTHMHPDFCGAGCYVFAVIVLNACPRVASFRDVRGLGFC